MNKVVPGPVDWNINEKELGLEQTMWRKRTIACRKLISAEDKMVLDVGAGNMYLKNILPDTVKYYPLDYTKRCEETIVCDLNKKEFPNIKVDVAVCAGIIGYLNDLEWFFDELTKSVNKIVLSYQSRERGFSWSLFTTDEIIRMLSMRGFLLTGWDKELSDDWPLLARFEKVTPQSLMRNYFCTGCGACVNKCPQNAIKLYPDKQGFLKPQIDDNRCVNCSLCVDVCPTTMLRTGQETPDTAVKCFAAWADDGIRKESSSGGAFTVFAQNILEQNGTVYGVEYTKDFLVQHTGVDKIADLEKLRHSKYVQSNTKTTYVEVQEKLKNNENVLYVGTPCQIAGLKAYLGEDYEGLLTIDLVCFCVTPITAFQEYLNECYGIDELSNVIFRDKYRGWCADGYTIHKKDGTVLHLGIDTDLYQKAFHHVLCRNSTCENCRFTSFPRQGDITLGDFWGIELHDPSWNDQKGTSLILANTAKGKRFIDNVKDQFQRVQQVPIDWCREKGNRIGNDGRPRHADADCFMEMIPRYGFKKSLDTVLNKKHDVAMVCMHNYNYGNNLTNYALYQCLSDMGLTVAVINRSLDSPWTEIKSDMAMFGHNPYVSCDLIPDFANRMDKKQVNDWCNTFVVASDQLFRGEFIEGMDFHPCLDWVSSNKYMFSYGTSFGTSDFNASDAVRGKTQFYLSRFNALSVREVSGVDILEKEFGLTAEWVLDPVFLCDRKYYYEMAQMGKMRLPETQYIGGYILDPSKEKEKVFYDINKELNFEINVIGDSVMNLEQAKQLWLIPLLPNALVEEWLANICYCDLFVTDSFHGVCFALIFKKNFIVITEPGNWRGRARFESILSLFNLQNRLIESSDELTDDLINESIDYDFVEKKLESLKHESMEWLKTQIKKGKEYKGKLDVYDLFDAKYDHTIRSNEQLKQQMENVRNYTEQQFVEFKQILNQLVEFKQGLEQKVDLVVEENKKTLSHNESLKNEVIGLKDSNHEIVTRLDEYEKTKKELELRNQQLNEQLSAVYASTSWRITKGLRFVKRLLCRK